VNRPPGCASSRTPRQPSRASVMAGFPIRCGHGTVFVGHELVSCHPLWRTVKQCRQSRCRRFPPCPYCHLLTARRPIRPSRRHTCAPVTVPGLPTREGHFSQR